MKILLFKSYDNQLYNNINDARLDLYNIMQKFTLDELHNELLSIYRLNRYTALCNLQLKGDIKTLLFLEKIYNHKLYQFRETAICLLGQFKYPINYDVSINIIPILLKSLNDKASSVRSSAISSLGWLKRNEDLDHIIALKNDKSEIVRCSLASALSKFKKTNKILPILIELTYDNKEIVREWAVLSITLLDFIINDINGIVLNSLNNRLYELLNDHNKEIRENIICKLSEYQDDRVYPFLLKGLYEKEINLYLLDASKDLGDKRLIARLKELLLKWSDNPPYNLVNIIQYLENK